MISGHIESQLQVLFGFLNPIYMAFNDESKNHAGHRAMADRKTDGDTMPSHLSILLVSDTFTPLNRLERHRLIYGAMGSYFDSGLHALRLTLFSPNEWRAQQGINP